MDTTTGPLPVLRPAQKDDEQTALEIERICMESYTIAVYGVWRPRKAMPSWFPQATEIVHICDAIAGCISFVRHETHFQLEQLYMLPNFRNHGHGMKLLRQKQALAQEAALPVKTRVLISNPARTLYERAGFETYEQTAERLFMRWQPVLAKVDGE